MKRTRASRDYRRTLLASGSRAAPKMMKGARCRSTPASASPLQNSVAARAVRTPRLRRRPLRKKSAGPSCGRTILDHQPRSGRATCLWSRALFRRRRPSPRAYSIGASPETTPFSQECGGVGGLGLRDTVLRDALSTLSAPAGRCTGREGREAVTESWTPAARAQKQAPASLRRGRACR